MHYLIVSILKSIFIFFFRFLNQFVLDSRLACPWWPMFNRLTR